MLVLYCDPPAFSVKIMLVAVALKATPTMSYLNKALSLVNFQVRFGFGFLAGDFPKTSYTGTYIARWILTSLLAVFPGLDLSSRHHSTKNTTVLGSQIPRTC